MNKELCECGKWMIEEAVAVLTSYPGQTQYRWWCGGCGATKQGRREAHQSHESIRMRQWENAQKGSEIFNAGFNKDL